MGGGGSQNTNSVQSTNQNFTDLSNMIQNMASQGLTTTNNNVNTTGQQLTAQNTNTTNNQNVTGSNTSNTTGATTGQQTGASSQQVNPWAPTLPALNNILASIQGQNTNLTPAQSAALAAAESSAGGMPNFGMPATNALANLYSNPNGIPQAGMWGGQFQNYANTVAPFTNFANLNPMSTPGFSDAMKTMNEDITKQIQGMYAGSGRDPTGAGSFAQSLGRGLSQGEGGLIRDQYNQNVNDYLGTAGNVLGGAERFATGSTNLLQTPTTNSLAAINASGQVPGLWMGPSSTQLGVANTAYGLPYSNIQIPQNMIQQIAGLGSSQAGQTSGQQSGTSQSGTVGTNVQDTTGSSTSAMTGATDTSGQQVSSGTQATQKQATGTSMGNQSGQAAGTSVGNSTTSQSQNPFATAAGIGLGLFSMFG